MLMSESGDNDKTISLSLSAIVQAGVVTALLGVGGLVFQTRELAIIQAEKLNYTIDRVDSLVENQQKFIEDYRKNEIEDGPG